MAISSIGKAVEQGRKITETRPRLNLTLDDVKPLYKMFVKEVKENGLEVKEEIMPISARLIANRSSYEYKKELIDRLISALSENKEERS